MKNKILLGLGVLLIMAVVACAGLSGEPFHSMVLGDTEYNTTPANIMAVFYDTTYPDGGLYMWWCDLSAEIIDNGDGTWDIYSPQFTATGVNQAIVNYGYYKYKVIESVYDEEGFELPQYMDDLGLESPEASDLPHSQHIGKLIAVDTGLVRPATIRRWWMGNSYDVQCLVSQTVVDQWMADTLNVNDWVVVSFIEENPDTEEINLAIVMSKVYKSWE